MSEPAPDACMRCGRTRSEATALESLSWVSETADSGPRWLCDRCGREHVRDIEGKLPHEYW